jgi:hypothetical protein
VLNHLLPFRKPLFALEVCEIHLVGRTETARSHDVPDLMPQSLYLLQLFQRADHGVSRLPIRFNLRQRNAAQEGDRFLCGAPCT